MLHEAYVLLVIRYNTSASIILSVVVHQCTENVRLLVGIWFHVGYYLFYSFIYSFCLPFLATGGDHEEDTEDRWK